MKSCQLMSVDVARGIELFPPWTNQQERQELHRWRFCPRSKLMYTITLWKIFMSSLKLENSLLPKTTTHTTTRTQSPSPFSLIHTKGTVKNSTGCLISSPRVLASMISLRTVRILNLSRKTYYLLKISNSKRRYPNYFWISQFLHATKELFFDFLKNLTGCSWLLKFSDWFLHSSHFL